MNILENYLVETKSVEPYEEGWTKEAPFNEQKFLKVKAVFNCYGRKQEETHILTTDEWEKIKREGYYLG